MRQTRDERDSWHEFCENIVKIAFKTPPGDVAKAPFRLKMANWNIETSSFK